MNLELLLTELVRFYRQIKTDEYRRACLAHWRETLDAGVFRQLEGRL